MHMNEEEKLAELIVRIRTASIRTVGDEDARIEKKEIVLRVLRQLSKFYDSSEESDRSAEDK